MSILSRTSRPLATMMMMKVSLLPLSPRLEMVRSAANLVEYIASGGNSSLILLHSLKSLAQESKYALIGHSLNVSTLDYSTKRRKLISGSWDKTARIWSKSTTGTESGEGDGGGESEWGCEMVLEGHDEAVWGVLAIDDGPQTGGWLTASGTSASTTCSARNYLWGCYCKCDADEIADRLIYLWNESGELLMRFKGSPEPVRSLCYLGDGSGFASACNDGSVLHNYW